jgi:hypothetical protein
MQKIDFLNEKEVIFCLPVKDFSENGKNTELSHGNIFVTHDDKKITHGNNIVKRDDKKITHGNNIVKRDDKKITHGVATKFSSKFCCNAVSCFRDAFEQNLNAQEKGN